MKLKLLMLFLLTGLIISGCGTARHKAIGEADESYRNPVENVLLNMSGSLREKISPDEGSANVAILDIFNESGRVTAMDSTLTGFLYDIFESDYEAGKAGLIIIDRELLGINMHEFDLKSTATDIERNFAVWKDINVDYVILGYWDEVGGEKIHMTLDIHDISKAGAIVFTISDTLTKNDQVHRLMGQKIPGTLYIKAQGHDIYAFIDGVPKGAVGKTERAFTLSPGNHSVRFKKDGFGSFTKSIRISEKDSEHLAVGATQPAGALTGSFITSAFLPGLAGLTYRPKLKHHRGWITLNLISAVFFYAGAVSVIVDNNKSRSWLTEKDADRFENIRAIEIISTATAYLLNLITGQIIGYEYMVQNRRLEEISRAGPEDRFLLTITQNRCNDKLLVISYEF